MTLNELYRMKVERMDGRRSGYILRALAEGTDIRTLVCADEDEREFAIDTASHRRGVGGIDRSQRIDLQRCIFLHDSRHPDGGGTATRRRSTVFGDDPVNAPDHDDGEQTDDGDQKRATEFDVLEHKGTVMTGW